MKKILLLSTGGTIASVASDSGLVPRESGEGLIKMLGQLTYKIEVRTHQIFNPKNGNLLLKKFMNTETIMTELSFHTGLTRWPIQHQCSRLCYKELIYR